MGREDEVRIIAYRLWEEEGCLDGMDCEHWYQAEAIWEEQQKPKTAVKTSTTESNQGFKRAKKATASRKKSSKT